MIQPLFRKFLVNRNDKIKQVDYTYDYKESMNMMRCDNGYIPVVDAAKHYIAEMTTFTRAGDESNDWSMQDLSTITKAGGENNDFALDLSLATKTFTATESDD